MINGSRMASSDARSRLNGTAVTWPLPLHNLGEAVHTLVTIFSLDDLQVLSRRLVKVLAEITGEEAEAELKCEPYEEEEPGTRPRTRYRRITPAERAEILSRHAAGDRYETIGEAVGRSVSTVNYVITKAGKEKENAYTDQVEDEA